MAKPAALQNSRFSVLTRTAAFRKLTKWAFSQCDSDGTGSVNQTELYAGILLVHIQLAKYAGAAACYPPTRAVIDSLFEASDDDNSGSIDEEEFTQILMVCCAQITSRILVYYAIIILLVPYVASAVMQGLLSIDDVLGWTDKHNYPAAVVWLENALGWSKIAEQTIYLALFFLLIPTFFDWIDSSSRRVAQNIETPQARAARKTS